MIALALAASTHAAPALADEHWQRVDLEMRATGGGVTCLRSISKELWTHTCTVQLVNRTDPFSGSTIEISQVERHIQLQDAQNARVWLSGNLSLSHAWLEPRHVSDLIKGQTYLVAHESESDDLAGERGGPLRWRLVTKRDIRTNAETATLTVSGFLHLRDYAPPSIRCSNAPPPVPSSRWYVNCSYKGVPTPVVTIIDGKIPPYMRVIEHRPSVASISTQGSWEFQIDPSAFPYPWSSARGGMFTLEATNSVGSDTATVTIPNPAGTIEATLVRAQAEESQVEEGSRVNLVARVSGRVSDLHAPGAVQFVVGSERIGAPVKLDEGFAELTTRLHLQPGRYQVHADYEPDGPFLAGRGTAAEALIIKAPTDSDKPTKKAGSEEDRVGGQKKSGSSEDADHDKQDGARPQDDKSSAGRRDNDGEKSTKSGS